MSLGTLTPREEASEGIPWPCRKRRASTHILEVPEGKRAEPLGRCSGNGKRWCDGQKAGEGPGDSGQGGHIIIPASTLMKPRPREVRGKSPCLRLHSLKEVRARVTHQSFKQTVRQESGTLVHGGEPRRAVVALTETSGISKTAVPFRKQASLGQMVLNMR